jgi:Pyruvate/2-oxoacid:ferredoxin oxidoreductase delta subunit
MDWVYCLDEEKKEHVENSKVIWWIFLKLSVWEDLIEFCYCESCKVCIAVVGTSRTEK